MKWEYFSLFGEARGETTTTRSGKPKKEETLSVIRDLGEEGWELTAVTINPHNQENGFYFKRPKTPETSPPLPEIDIERFQQWIDGSVPTKEFTKDELEQFHHVVETLAPKKSIS